MAYTLRPYQQDAVNATVNWFRDHAEPALIVLPTGAGKSLIIAELAKLARGRVLVLAHVKELVEQNHAKYCSYALDADIFSSGLQQKRSAGKVVFGSVQSVARNLALFNNVFSLLIVDECHRISDNDGSQYKLTLQHLRKLNPKLRLLGLTATPYRLGEGWIYQYHYHGMTRGDENNLFRDCIYELPLRYMIKNGFLVPPKRLDMPVQRYDFSRLRSNNLGLFQNDDLNKELNQQRRITPHIIKQIIDYSRLRKGTMIFAATVEHAREIYHLLPPEQAGLVCGETPSVERNALITAFKQQQLRYLVNVSVLTTGFDAPHVDVIAILRPTESVSLYQQMVGRGLRLAPNKKNCLILDYSGNLHDLYTPEPGGRKPDSDSLPVQIFCPDCDFANIFWGKYSEAGDIIEHYGRRCQSWQTDAQGVRTQCHYRFRFKNCPHCSAENDIAARHCHQCQKVLVDPDDMLKNALRLKDALILRCGGMTLQADSDHKGEWLKVTYYDEDGTHVSERLRLATSAPQKFLRQHQRAPGVKLHWRTAADISAQQTLLRHPDFVIAQRRGRFMQIREKIFDYYGRFRRANTLS